MAPKKGSIPDIVQRIIWYGNGKIRCAATVFVSYLLRFLLCRNGFSGVEECQRFRRFVGSRWSAKCSAGGLGGGKPFLNPA